ETERAHLHSGAAEGAHLHGCHCTRPDVPAPVEAHARPRARHGHDPGGAALGPAHGRLARRPARGGGADPARDNARARALVRLALTGLAGALGPRLSGLLASFPVLATVLAAFTHAQEGPAAAAQLLRGFATGLVAFAAFCFAVAELLPRSSVAVAFLASAGIALVAHALSFAVQRAIAGRARP